MYILTRFRPDFFLNSRTFTYHMENPAQDREYTINCKRKVVQFVYRWVVTIRHPVFDDVVSMSFLEVYFHNL